MQPLAFVDLETTGATATVDRITEVGIVLVDEHGVREWSSLVNPQTRIPEFIERLTGISNAMVQEAPPFEELADTIVGLLEGRLFIAHNARFDYSFLKNEFKRLERTFRPTVLCTVKLSRKLYPAHHRHNLDSLIERHGLTVSDRHRALGDAQLIHQFWQIVQSEFPMEEIEQAVQTLTARPSLPSHLDEGLIDDLPEGPGVYLFYGENELPLYIGKSTHIRKRVLSHFSADHSNGKEMSLSQQVRRIDWIETEGELGALLLEAQLIKERLPTLNHRLRRSNELCAWKLEQKDGHLRPVLRWEGDLNFGSQDNLYGLFHSKRDAMEALRSLAQEYTLCPAILGLEKVKPGQACFSVQLKKCNGACKGTEQPEEHATRLVTALSKIKLKTWPYAGPVGIIEGKAMHVVDRWCHLGTANNEVELADVLEHGKPSFDRDTYKILTKSIGRHEVRELASQTLSTRTMKPPV